MRESVEDANELFRASLPDSAYQTLPDLSRPALTREDSLYWFWGARMGLGYLWHYESRREEATDFYTYAIGHADAYLDGTVRGDSLWIHNWTQYASTLGDAERFSQALSAYQNALSLAGGTDHPVQRGAILDSLKGLYDAVPGDSLRSTPTPKVDLADFVAIVPEWVFPLMVVLGLIIDGLAIAYLIHRARRRAAAGSPSPASDPQ